MSANNTQKFSERVKYHLLETHANPTIATLRSIMAREGRAYLKGLVTLGYFSRYKRIYKIIEALYKMDRADLVDEIRGNLETAYKKNPKNLTNDKRDVEIDRLFVTECYNAFNTLVADATAQELQGTLSGQFHALADSIHSFVEHRRNRLLKEDDEIRRQYKKEKSMCASGIPANVILAEVTGFHKTIVSFSETVRHKHYDQFREKVTVELPNDPSRKKDMVIIVHDDFNDSFKVDEKYVPQKSFVALDSEQQREEIYPGAERKEKIKFWLKVAALAVTFFVACGEGFVPFFFMLTSGGAMAAFPLLPFIMVPALLAALWVGISGFGSNFVLFRKDCYDLFKMFVIDGLCRKKDGSPISKKHQRVVYTVGAICATGALGMGLVTFFASFTILFGMKLSFGVALGLAAFIAVCTTLAIGCAIFVVVANYAINYKETWQKLKNFFVNGFGKDATWGMRILRSLSLLTAFAVIFVLPIVIYCLYGAIAAAGLTVLGLHSVAPLVIAFAFMGMMGYLLFAAPKLVPFIESIYKSIAQMGRGYVNHIMHQFSAIKNYIANSDGIVESAFKGTVGAVWTVLNIASLGILTGMARLVGAAWTKIVEAKADSNRIAIMHMVFQGIKKAILYVFMLGNGIGQGQGIKTPEGQSARTALAGATGTTAKIASEVGAAVNTAGSVALNKTSIDSVTHPEKACPQIVSDTTKYSENAATNVSDFSKARALSRSSSVLSDRTPDDAENKSVEDRVDEALAEIGLLAAQ